MKRTSIEIIVEESFKNAIAGVYKIQFSNGLYYVGCSKNLQSRLLQHKTCINSDFSSNATPNPLRAMAGFKGTATFSLVMPIDSSLCSNYGHQKNLVEIETAYIKQNINDRRMLNLIVSGKVCTYDHYGQPRRWKKYPEAWIENKRIHKYVKRLDAKDKAIG